MKELGKHLFWDADYSQLNLDKHSGYIIPRVMDYGSWEDVQFVFGYYPRPRIKEILLNAPALQIRTIHFFAHLFLVPLEAFKAYNKLKLAHWNR